MLQAIDYRLMKRASWDFSFGQEQTMIQQHGESLAMPVMDLPLSC